MSTTWTCPKCQRQFTRRNQRHACGTGVVMRGALRLAIHLPRQVAHPLFIKVGRDRNHVTHVAKIHRQEEFETLKPFLREAFEASTA